MLSEDYFNVPEERIRGLESVLTIVNGKPVYAVSDFAEYDRPTLPVMPDWSPVAKFGGYGAPGLSRSAKTTSQQVHTVSCGILPSRAIRGPAAQLWGSGCDCFAF